MGPVLFWPSQFNSNPSLTLMGVKTFFVFVPVSACTRLTVMSIIAPRKRDYRGIGGFSSEPLSRMISLISGLETPHKAQADVSFRRRPKQVVARLRSRELCKAGIDLPLILARS